jgi:hypothetical protein
MPMEVFLSYSHKDEVYKKDLEIHLSALEKQKVITTWNDRMIAPGDEWKNKINCHIEDAKIILLLVSPDFIASDYCHDEEMTRALERHETGDTCVIPIIIRPCLWKETPLARLQALPSDARPVSTWSDRDEAFVNIVQGIKKAIEKIKPGSLGEPPISRQILKDFRKLINVSQENMIELMRSLNNTEKNSSNELGILHKSIDDFIKYHHINRRFLVGFNDSIKSLTDDVSRYVDIISTSNEASRGLNSAEQKKLITTFNNVNKTLDKMNIDLTSILYA